MLPTIVGSLDGPAPGRPAGSARQLANHWPVQISTLHEEPLVTQDGIPVRVTATLAWSRTPDSEAGPPRTQGRNASDSSAGMPGEVAANGLTREALRSMAMGCGLATLLGERHGAEEQVRLDAARRGAASGLLVHLVRIRTVDIPASVQADGDARQMLAMRACLDRRRATRKSAQGRPHGMDVGHLIR